ncbi:hypothetical protein ACA910_007014 [Epithemia clementina (nom. ined.)]
MSSWETCDSTNDESMSGVDVVQHRLTRPVASMALLPNSVNAGRPNMGPWPKVKGGPRWCHSMVVLEQEQHCDKDEGVDNHREREDITVVVLGGQQRHGQRDNSVLLLTIPVEFLTSLLENDPADFESSTRVEPACHHDGLRTPLTWYDGPPLLKPRINCAAVICNSYLYVIGGCGHGIRVALDSIERILVSDLHQWVAAQSAAAKNVTIPTTPPPPPPVWTPIESRLRTPRSGSSAVAVANRFIVVLGGLGSQGEPLSSVEIIDTKAVREIAGNNGVPTLAPVVVEGPSLRIPRYLFGAAVLPDQNEIWVVGGKDEHGNPSSSIESLRFGAKHNSLDDPSVREFFPLDWILHGNDDDRSRNQKEVKPRQENHENDRKQPRHRMGSVLELPMAAGFAGHAAVASLGPNRLLVVGGESGDCPSPRPRRQETDYRTHGVHRTTTTSVEVISLFSKEPLHRERDSIDVAFSSATLGHFAQPRTGYAIVQIKCKGRRTSGPNNRMARERMLVLVSGGLCDNNKGLESMESVVLTLPEPRNDEMLFHTERIALLRASNHDGQSPAIRPGQLSRDYVQAILTDTELVPGVSTRGSFGTVVHEGQDLVLGKSFVVKTMCPRVPTDGCQMELEVQKLNQYHQHRSVIGLLGYSLPHVRVCAGQQYHLLYEMPEKGSLDRFWNPNGRERLFFPPTRIGIALDVMTALQFLHTGGGSRSQHDNKNTTVCFHGEVKSSHIYLDGKFRAKLFLDCEKAMFLEYRMKQQGTGKRALSSFFGNHEATTPGCIHPWSETSETSNKADDILSFGIVLAELWTGKLQTRHSNGAGADHWESEAYQKYVVHKMSPLKDIDDCLDFERTSTGDIPGLLCDFADLMVACLSQGRKFPSDSVIRKLTQIYDASCSSERQQQPHGDARPKANVAPPSPKRCETLYVQGDLGKNLDDCWETQVSNSIPMYFVILPRDVTAECNPWEILKSLFTSAAKQKLNLFFICAHSGAVVSPPIKLAVSRPWFRIAAPILIWSLQALSMAFEAVSFPAALDMGKILHTNLALDKRKAILEAIRTDIRDNCNTASHDLIERICPDTVNGEDMNRIYNQIKGMDQCSINFLEEQAKSQCRAGGWREQMTQVLHKTSTGVKVKWVKNQFAQLPEYEPILKRENLPKHEQRRLAAEL